MTNPDTRNRDTVPRKSPGQRKQGVWGDVDAGRQPGSRWPGDRASPRLAAAKIAAEGHRSESTLGPGRGPTHCERPQWKCRRGLGGGLSAAARSQTRAWRLAPWSLHLRVAAAGALVPSGWAPAQPVWEA